MAFTAFPSISSIPLLPAADPMPSAGLETVGTPQLWTITIAAVIGLFIADFLITRKPHAVTMREAVGWSAFYVAIPLAFGGFIWSQFGGERGVEYYTGYLVEKTLSVDNLFIFMLLMAAFAVPKELQQRVLLIGVAGALVLRGIFIAVGAQMLTRFDWTFLLFGAILILTAVKVLRDAASDDDHIVDPSSMKIVQLLHKVRPVTPDYRGTKMFDRLEGVPGRAMTPLFVVTMAILGTDIIFAIDSVPAVYGITGDPYLVFATNAFALLGLRALYFVLEGALSKLVHLGYGLGLILAFIGVKLILHWAHGIWPGVPTVPTLASLGVIVGVLAVVTVTSLRASAAVEARLAHTDAAAKE